MRSLKKHPSAYVSIRQHPHTHIPVVGGMSEEFEEERRKRKVVLHT